MSMADAAGSARAGPWYLRAGRAAGAGLTGVVVGAGVAGIWHAGWEAAGKACRGAGFDAFCLPVGQAAVAVLGSSLVIRAGVFLGFFLLQVRPKRLTIPVGCVLAAMLIWAVGVGIPGGTPPPAWTTALAAGAGLTSLALMVDSGIAQIAGFVAIAIVVAGAFAAPRLIQSRIQQDARERQLAALRFPLMLPVAAGDPRIRRRCGQRRAVHRHVIGYTRRVRAFPPAGLHRQLYSRDDCADEART